MDHQEFTTVVSSEALVSTRATSPVPVFGCRSEEDYSDPKWTKTLAVFPGAMPLIKE